MTVIDILHLSAAILTCAAAFGWLNTISFKLPHAIAMLLFSLILSMGLIAVDRVSGGHIAEYLGSEVAKIQFNETLMIGMLSFLLFAGALHTNLEVLLTRKWPVLLMATFGVLLSTFIVGYVTHYMLAALDIALSLKWCLVFGALISPTDPVAVMAILKKVELPDTLEAMIGGESLFNDGMGVVVFIVMLTIATSSSDVVDYNQIASLFATEVIGGILVGLVCGWVAFLAMRKIDEYSVEVLISLALVTGVYSVCQLLHASGPLAVVVAGLLIGNHGMKYAMSEKTRQQLEDFWSMLDEILNSILFILIGLEALVLGFSMQLIVAAAVIVPVVLAARFTSVALSIKIISVRQHISKGAIQMLTWAGLRGGISVALALSLPQFEGRDTIVIMTYGLVICSILVQGLTIERLARRIESYSMKAMKQYDSSG